MPLPTGTILNNRYRIVKLLGQGGFGAVYRAWDLNIESECAVKENLDTSPEAQNQFRKEAIILANLQHPNLPRVRNHFFLPGQGQYLVMDFVEGEDLHEILSRTGSPLSESQVLPWIQQICDALAYLHEQNPPVIHRDIKPANIKITSVGKAMLVDFGIAKVFDPNLSTTAGAQAITPGYSPHEQYGQGKTDNRSDIYALGATLYTLLTNKEPVESIQRVVVDTLPLAEKCNPAVTSRTARIIHRAMQVNPDKRYQSASGFKTAITGDKFELRRPNWLLLVSIIGVVIIGSISIWLFKNIPIGSHSPTPSVDVLPSHTPTHIEATEEPDTAYLTETAHALDEDLIGSLAATAIYKINLTQTAAPTESIIPTVTSTDETHLPTITLTPEVIRSRIIVSKSYVRSGPGTAYRWLETTPYNEGDSLIIQARNVEGSWLYVFLPDGCDGWIALNDVEINFDVDSLPAKIAPPTPIPFQLIEPTRTPKPGGNESPPDQLKPTNEPYPYPS